MNAEQIKLTNRLLNRCQSYDEWLTVMNFGMETLISDPVFLYELIREKAARLPQPGESPSALSEVIAHICASLNLEFEMSFTMQLKRGK